MQKSVHLKNVSFFFNFGSHWALQGMGSYAIRTRLCSPNTLFGFRFCLQKCFPKSVNWVHFGIPFGLKCDICVKKKRFEKCFNKKVPARLKQNSIHRPGGPWRSSLACALFKQETVVWATVEALFEILAEKKVCWVQIRCTQLNGLLNRGGKNEWIAETCRLLKTKANVET